MQAASPANRTRLLTAWGGALCVLAAAAMLLYGFNNFSMWFDEIRMLQPALAWNPLDLSTWTFRPGHPPLYFILLRGWIALGGTSDFSLRMLSGLTGVLAAAVIVRVGKDLSGSLFGGVAAGLLFGAMGFVRYFVHETHNYALLMLVCSILILFYERWWAHPTRRAYAVGSVLATAGAMYTHYYAVYFILSLNLIVVIAGWRRVRDSYRWVSFQVMAALLYIPWMGVVLVVARSVVDRIEGNKPRGRGINANSTKWSTIVETVNTLLSDQLVLFAILGIVGVVGLVLLVRTRRENARKTLSPVLLLSLLVIGSLAMALIANLYFRTFNARRVIYVLPALVLLIGYMLVGLPRLVREGVLVAAVVLIYSGGYSSLLPGDWRFRQIIETIDQTYRPNDLVFFQMPEASLSGLPLSYYAQEILPRHAPVMTLEDAGLETLDSQRYFADDVFAQRVLARDSFWVVSSTDPDFGEPSLAWVEQLDRPFKPVLTDQVGIFAITLFTAPTQTRKELEGGDDLSGMLELPVTFGDNQFELDRAQVSSKVVDPGGELVVWLDWRELAPPDQDYAVYVHLLKGENIIAQQDGDPVHLGDPLPTSLWPLGVPVYDEHRLQIPGDTPPGAYLLVVGLYDRVTGARLQVTPPGVTIGGLTLAAIEVTSQ